MKKLSEVYTEAGIAFQFPIQIRDVNGKETYYEGRLGDVTKRKYDPNGNEIYCERSNGFWSRYEYNSNSEETYYENSDGYWCKHEYNSDGNESYSEDSNGVCKGTPKTKPCSGKIVEIDGVEYKLTAL